MTLCEQAAEWIDAWFDDVLSDEDAARLASHCEACEACRRARDQARRLRDDMAQLAAAAGRMCSDPYPITTARASAFGKKRTRQAWMWRIAAVLVLATTISIGWRWWPADSTSPSSVVVVEPSRNNAPAVLELADAEGIVLRHPSHEMAVQYTTRNPAVQIVWLYAPLPDASERSTTSAPGT